MTDTPTPEFQFPSAHQADVRAFHRLSSSGLLTEAQEKAIRRKLAKRVAAVLAERAREEAQTWIDSQARTAVKA